MNDDFFSEMIIRVLQSWILSVAIVSYQSPSFTAVIPDEAPKFRTYDGIITVIHKVMVLFSTYICCLFGLLCLKDEENSYRVTHEIINLFDELYDINVILLLYCNIAYGMHIFGTYCSRRTTKAF